MRRAATMATALLVGMASGRAEEFRVRAWNGQSNRPGQSQGSLSLINISRCLRNHTMNVRQVDCSDKQNMSKYNTDAPRVE